MNILNYSIECFQISIHSLEVERPLSINLVQTFGLATTRSVPLSADVVGQLQFEVLIADLSARFFNLPANQRDFDIEAAQVRRCECLGIDHSAWYQIIRLWLT